jgi:hypothetical protein
MKFMLEIELGNDAMQTVEDVCEALRFAATRVNLSYEEPEADSSIPLYDRNGNTIGEARFIEAST